MAVKQFDAEAMAALDDKTIAAALNVHIRRASADCVDRPGEKKARVVTLQFAIVPVLMPDGSCDKVNTQFQIKSKIPDHRSRVYSMGLRRNGMLVVNEDSLDDVDQSTFLGGDDE